MVEMNDLTKTNTYCSNIFPSSILLIPSSISFFGGFHSFPIYLPQPPINNLHSNQAHLLCPYSSPACSLLARFNVQLPDTAQRQQTEMLSFLERDLFAYLSSCGPRGQSSNLTHISGDQGGWWHHLHTFSASLSVSGISWKGAHVWWPSFHGCHPGYIPRKLGSGGQQNLHSWVLQDCNSF